MKNTEEKNQKLSRRGLLKTTARAALAVVGAGLIGVAGAKAQISGLEPGGGTPPFRLPMGALDYLDRKQYIHNMEIVSHLSGHPISEGEPLMSMWAGTIKLRSRLTSAGP